MTINEKKPAFTLIEILLAMGIIGVSVIALLALLGQTLPAVRDVVDKTIADNALGKVDAYIQRDAIYDRRGNRETDPLTGEDLGNSFEEVFDWVDPSVALYTDIFAYNITPESTEEQDSFEKPMYYLEIVTQSERVMQDHFDEGRIAGPVFLFRLTRSTMLDDNNWDVDKMTFIPLFVRVFSLENPEDIPDDDTTAQRDVLYRYTTARQR